MAEDILDSDPKSVASGEKEKEDDENLESKKREKAIVEWIGRPLKPPWGNKDEDEDEDEDIEYEQEYIGSPVASIEDDSPSNKDDEDCEEDQEDDGIYNRKNTVHYIAKDNKEEVSLGHESE